MSKLASLAILSAFLFAKASAQAAGQGVSSADNTTVSQDPCALTAIGSDYNLGLHIGGIFITMAVSSVGIMGSIAIGSHEQLKKNQSIMMTLQYLKFFGCGVVIATAWIHLLADGYSQFLNPCLVGDTWVNWGANFPGWIALASGLSVQVLEYFAMNRQFKLLDQNPDKHEDVKQSEDLTLEEAVGHHGHDDITLSPQEVAAQSIGTVFLEVGVIFHSVVIGLALGIVTTEWSTLIAAICFHQLFEGMALGTRISVMNISWVTKYFGMAIFYPLTTPLGIAIGIGLRYTYNPNSQTAILIQGTLDSAAGGILMYNGYVQLVATEMNHNPRFFRYTGWQQFFLYVAFTLGLAAMSIIGLWA